MFVPKGNSVTFLRGGRVPESVVSFHFFIFWSWWVHCSLISSSVHLVSVFLNNFKDCQWGQNKMLFWYVCYSLDRRYSEHNLAASLMLPPCIMIWTREEHQCLDTAQMIKTAASSSPLVLNLPLGIQMNVNRPTERTHQSWALASHCIWFIDTVWVGIKQQNFWKRTVYTQI